MRVPAIGGISMPEAAAADRTAMADSNVGVAVLVSPETIATPAGTAGRSHRRVCGLHVCGWCGCSDYCSTWRSAAFRSEFGSPSPPRQSIQNERDRQEKTGCRCSQPEWLPGSHRIGGGGRRDARLLVSFRRIFVSQPGDIGRLFVTPLGRLFWVPKSSSHHQLSSRSHLTVRHNLPPVQSVRQSTHRSGVW